MATENRSPSYNGVRDFVRSWASRSREGSFAVQNIREWSQNDSASHIFDDDRWTTFEDWYAENKGNLALAANNQAIRDAHQTGFAPTKTRLRRFASVPMGYHLRRIAETGDPQYWNDPRNMLKEVIENPWFATMPLWYIRGQYEALLPKGTTVALFGPDGKLAKSTTPEIEAVREEPAVIQVPLTAEAVSTTISANAAA